MGGQRERDVIEEQGRGFLRARGGGEKSPVGATTGTDAASTKLSDSGFLAIISGGSIHRNKRFGVWLL